MNRLQRAAVLTRLAEELRDKNGIRSGDLGFQKGAFMLQEILDVALGFDFLYYKGSPFSFGLQDDLTALVADGLLEFGPQPYPATPGFQPTETAKELQTRYPRTLTQYRQQIDFVAGAVRGQGPVELTDLTTALYAWKESGEGALEAVATRMRELKPNLSIEERNSVLDRLTSLLGSIKSLQDSVAGSGLG